MTADANLLRSLALLIGTVLCSACRSGTPEGKPQGQPTASTAVAVAASAPPVVPRGPQVVPQEMVDKVTNPSARALYEGPVGGVRGTIRVEGDQAPVLKEVVRHIPVGKCFAAHKRYKHLFREGAGRSLADVLVAVTRYQGQLKAPTQPVRVEASDCAFDRRTVAMSFGQSLEVANVGKVAQTPDLVGAKARALLIAMPGGSPVRLNPQQPGLYQLLDRSHEYAFADVYVLAYPTADVTGLDGKYEIQGIPVGSAHLDALLPITGQTIAKEIEIQAGKTIELDLVLNFDAERDGSKAVDALDKVLKKKSAAAASQ